tara:strand:+ start:700 stop:1623 length:924 start_codon:yes stop_codon:yes gene_type:complete
VGLVILGFIAIIVVLFVHPKTKKWSVIRNIRTGFKDMFDRSPPPPPPAPVEPVADVKSKSSEPGNVPRVKDETGKEPDTEDVHEFPPAREAATRFEEFNAKLFLYQPSEDERRWDETADSDFATQVAGENHWVKAELKKRLRPAMPVIFDPFGLWARASGQLELDPHFDDPVVSAYLALDRSMRPAVVSRIPQEGDAQRKVQPIYFTLYRYGFIDYRFDRKFLEDYPADLLIGLLKAFSGPEDGWETFSPARLRKEVLEENREEEAHRQAMAAHQHANRFAALWELRDDAADPADAADEETEAEPAQ